MEIRSEKKDEMRTDGEEKRVWDRDRNINLPIPTHYQRSSNTKMSVSLRHSLSIRLPCIISLSMDDFTQTLRLLITQQKYPKNNVFMCVDVVLIELCVCLKRNGEKMKEKFEKIEIYEISIISLSSHSNTNPFSRNMKHNKITTPTSSNTTTTHVWCLFEERKMKIDIEKVFEKFV